MKNWETYLFEYGHNGKRWSVEIPAESMDDARLRLRNMVNAEPMGTLVMTVPAGGGWFARAYCGLRNLLAWR